MSPVKQRRWRLSCTVHPRDLLRVHHEKIEAWILEQAWIVFDARARRAGETRSGFIARPATVSGFLCPQAITHGCSAGTVFTELRP